MSKTPRNSQCPCGSGKKFKKCCGDAALLSAKYHENKARWKAALQKRMEERERAEVSRTNHGIRRHSPLTSVAMVAALLSIGMPPHGRTRL